MKLLMTGFNAFGGEDINPSWRMLEKLDLSNYDSEIHLLEVPTEFEKSRNVLEEKLLEIKPDLVLLFGQAGGRNAISIERVAININDAKSADNSGYIPKDETIYPDGKNAYFSTLPIKELEEQLHSADIPAYISNSAGTYVCNNLFYTLMYLIEKNDLSVKGGFIHVPFEHKQVLNRSTQASMSLNDLTIAVDSIVRYLEENESV